jgi:hypothetical protein
MAATWARRPCASSVVLTNPEENLVKQVEVVIHAKKTTELKLKLK